MGRKKGLLRLCGLALAGLMLAGCVAVDPQQELETQTGQGQTAEEDSAGENSALGDNAQVPQVLPAEDAAVLGLLAPLTGEDAALGLALQRGAQLAVEQHNAAQGWPLRLESADDQGDPQQAEKAYRELKKKEIIGLVGSPLAETATAVAQLISSDYQEGEGIPAVFSSTAATVPLHGSSIFGVGITDQQQGRALLAFVADTLGVTSVAVVYDSQQNASTSLVNAFAVQAAARGITVSPRESAVGEDLSQRLDTLLEQEPGAILLPGPAQEVLPILRMLREKGYQGPVLGNDRWEGIQNLLEEGEEELLAQCSYTAQFHPGDSATRVAAFVEDYTQRYGEAPGSWAALGYDGAMLLAQALEGSGTTDAQTMTAALAGMEYEGVTGKMSFSASGEAVKEARLLGFDGGQLVWR